VSAGVYKCRTYFLVRLLWLLCLQQVYSI